MKAPTTMPAAALACFLALSCASAGGHAPGYSPTFDFTPPSAAVPGASGVTLALVSAGYSQTQPWTRVQPFSALSASLGADFEELLTARGFSVKGPFRSYEEMVFPDKQASDLVLVPNLDLSVSVQDVRQAKVELLTGKIKYKGTAVIGGRVNLWLSESLTGTRMWSKSIPVVQASVPWESQTWRSKNEAFAEADVYADRGFAEAVGPTLERLYAETLRTAWAYLDPSEVQLVRGQAQDVKKRAVFGARP